MAIEDASTRKAGLRKEMRSRIRDSRRDSRELLGALKGALEGLESQKRIAIYSALPDEPTITELITELPQHQWLLPRVEGENLVFHRITNPTQELRSGAFGILEPLPDLPTIRIEEIEIFVCPGLAFDIHGGRLGRGRGFYDRMLADARENALKIGVGFDCQMVEDTYTEEHDVRMDAVLCHG